MPTAKRKVCIALSGGVDSAVSAYLLKEAGFDVFAAFIKVWQPDFLECSQEVDRQSAKRVAASLGIPFHVVDLSKLYKKQIVDSFLSSYERGETPNPDVLCNKIVKFGGLWDWAQKQGATAIASGHYAQILQDSEGSFSLQKAVDVEKDQVYFLWELEKNKLPHIMFPIGGLKKSEVRAIALRVGLHVATKKDSQGLCFMGMLDMHTFLQKMSAVGPKQGNVLGTSGKVIGTHDGAYTYTIGQRHNFSLRVPTSQPMYVQKIDVAANTITVASDQVPQSRILVLRDCVWRQPPEQGLQYAAQIRYHGELRECTIVLDKSKAIVTLRDECNVSRGQSCVVYMLDTCIGGGFISSAE